jgi:cell division GTPase FtsZ
MSAQVSRGTLQSEVIMDDVSNNENKETGLPPVDEEKMAKLKARLAAKEAAQETPKESEMTDTQQVQPEQKVEKKKSINFGIVGSGQAGNRIAEAFYKLGYDAVAINTAPQDLKFITIPESNKLLLDYSLGGAAKEIEIGFRAAEHYKTQIAELVSHQLADAQILILALSLGGGSGAGSCEVLVDILSATGKPLAVITVLPMNSEDVQTKDNAIKTLAKLTRLTQSKKVHNLIVIDNAKIETIYSNVSQIDFFGMANKAIVEPIDAFNTLSSLESSVKGLDPMEFAKLFTNGDGLTVYGSLKITDYKTEDAIALAVVDSLDSNLLAGGFNLKQSKYVGFMIVANEKVWRDIPASQVSYALACVDEQCGSPETMFKGIYTDNSMPDDYVMIYSMFSGLGLPDMRVQQLKKEINDLSSVVKNKDVQRNMSLTLDTGKDQAVSKSQELKEKIAQRNSAFGRLTNSTVIDRRK